MTSFVILLYVVVPLVLAYVLYFVLRKAIAHGIRDARHAESREAREARESLESRADAP